jgi:hypothetical protein
MLHWQALPGLAKLPLFRSGTAGRQRVPFKPFKQFSGHWGQTMSIFGKIMSAIFGTKADAAPAGGGVSGGGGAPASTGSAPAAAPAQSVDVAPILDKAVPPRAKSWIGAPRSSI